MKMRCLLISLLLITIIPQLGLCQITEGPITLHEWTVGSGEKEDYCFINFSMRNKENHSIPNVIISVFRNGVEIFNETVNFSANEIRQFEATTKSDNAYNVEYAIYINNTRQHIISWRVSEPGPLPYPYWIMGLGFLLIVGVVVLVYYLRERKKKG